MYLNASLSPLSLSTSDSSANEPAPSLLGLLRRYGYTTVSFQALEPGVRVHGELASGAVAYADTGAAWVAAGGPIAPPELLGELAGQFVRDAAARGRRACFCASEARLVLPELSRVRIGEQPVWDPRGWPGLVASSRNLKEQLRRARAKGVRVRAVERAELEPGQPTREALDALVARWLGTRRGPRLRFLLDVHLFEHTQERMIFVAEREGVLVGAISAVPVYARTGWFLEDVLRGPRAPNGTAEALIDAAMRAAAGAGSTHVTMGLVPLCGEVPAWLRAVKWLGRPFYDFDGLWRFRQKLKPQGWEPVYVAYPRGRLPVVALWDTLTAVMGMSPLRWAQQATLRRGG